ncbi:MAG: glutamine-hydrolyzing carbamoyl-phosphate synthase small subunit [Candidatus Methanospirareceae archaeon]
MKAILAIEDGTVVEGEGFGAEGIALGELVFSTPVVGYEEALTDPSYKGQILMFTYPLIGNYGVSGEKFQSDGIKVEGFVIREKCDYHSHYKSKKSIEEWLKEEGIPGISEVDTRMLTIKTRRYGTMKACLVVGEGCTEEREKERALELARNQPDISKLKLIEEVTCKQPYRIKGEGKRIAVIDFGVKRNILKSLMRRGFDIFVFPADTDVRAIKEVEPLALFLSNGPGDPKMAKEAMEVVKELVGTIPIFGICLGHQIIALALGGETYKMKFGHRGINQPVKDFKRKCIYITSQNHGFAVDGASIENIAEVTQLNANDNTVEGFEDSYLGIKCVQYHPEASPGPLDTEKVFFDEIMKVIENFFV